jgi:hypothetical protein
VFQDDNFKTVLCSYDLRTILNTNLRKLMKLAALLPTILFFLFLSPDIFASYQAPAFRMKAGYSGLSIKAGDRIKGEPLKSTLTIQPSLLWDLPTFRSRLGVHFLADFQSDFGQMPISGMGISGCFYVQQISSAYEYSQEGVLHQRSKPGFFISGSITPANINLNREASKNADFRDIAFATLVMDLIGGVGFDWPIGTNFILSGELAYRVGANQTSSANSQNVSYSGLSFFISFLTAYY